MSKFNNFKSIDTNYKEYIQSLRGISVLLVFLYHCNIKLFKNGYLGVDIFFVISGFVITQVIYKDYLRYNKFLISNFFIRRIKRIFPNLFFIVITTYILWLLFSPPDLSLWNETIFSILGISNLFYLFESRDYFNNVFENPLAHTWSLGVEEQFYLLYPFLFLLFKFFKNKIKSFLVILSLIAISSFLISMYLQNSYSKFVFYLSPLRFWEFIFGSIIFFFNASIKKNNIFGLISLLSIFIVIIFGDIINSFYLVKNFLVIIFSCIFILYSDNKIFLTNKYLVYFGSISYSFYLWHLPIIFFTDLYMENYLINIIISLSLTTLLSIITYIYVETYFRKSVITKKKINYLVTIFFLFLSLIIYIMYFQISLRKNLNVLIKKFNYLEIKHDWNNRMVFYTIKISDNKIYDHCLDNSKIFTLDNDGLKNECLKKKNNNILFFAEGNSHTAQYITALNNIELIENLYYKHTESYKLSIELLNKISYNFNKIVYVTDVNDFEKFNLIKDNIINLNKNIELLIFNSTPFSENKKKPFKCIIQNIDCFINKDIDMKNRDLYNLFEQLNLFKENNYSRFKIFDSYNSLCPKNLCPIYSKEKNLIYYRDDTHLVPEGARQLIPMIILFIKSNYTL